MQRALEALDKQTLSKDQWELLVIDNASEELLSEKWSLSWHPNARHIREEELGLTPARLRGIKESLGEILVFVDDDNILGKNYLKISFELAQEHPHLGVFGAARILPEFEIKPDPELEPYLPMLALRCAEQSITSQNETDPFSTPWGAGLVVRKKVGLAYMEKVRKCPIRKSLDRKGNQLVSGGDDEFSRVACEMGACKGIFTKLELTHLIPAERLERPYLLRMAEGHAYTSQLMQAIHGDPPSRPRDLPSLWKVAREIIRLRRSLVLFEWRRWRQARANTFANQIRDARQNGARRAKLDIKQGVFNLNEKVNR